MPRSVWILTSFALAASPPALAFDADGDGSPDPTDAYPCDPGATGAVFAPGLGAHGRLLFEDEWPELSDLDFNDAVVAYNVGFQVDDAGRAVGLRAQFNLLAIGGVFDNGLGWHLPVPSSAVAQVTRAVGTNPPTPLTPSSADQELTVTLSSNLRELFGGVSGTINSEPAKARLQGEVLTVEVVFASPQALDTSKAPFDVYIFRSANPSHEIHQPAYAGTAAMDTALFGSGVDASSPTRSYVDVDGLPYALHMPRLGSYPREGTDIATLWPAIVTFASSGGAAAQDFDLQTEVAAAAYTPAQGGPLAPITLGQVAAPAQTGCIRTWGLSVDFGTSLSQFAFGATTDANGDAIVAGYVQDALPGHTNAGGLDVFVAKYDGLTGAELWTTQIGTSADDVARDVAVGADGTIVVVGETSGDLDGQVNGGGKDAFVASLSANGVLQWTRLLGGAADEVAYGVALDANGDAFVGGGASSGVLPGAMSNNLGASNTPSGTNGPTSFLARFATNGQALWVDQFVTDVGAAQHFNYTLDVAVDRFSGAVYSVGAERRYGRHAAASESQFVTRHEAGGGALSWITHIGDHGYHFDGADHRYAYAYGVATDDFDGSAYVAGHWYAGTSVSAWGDWARALGDSSADATLSKVSPAGVVQWSQALASVDQADERGEAVRVVLDGAAPVPNAATSVVFAGRTGGDVAAPSLGGDDYFAARFTKDGARQWVVQNGTPDQDEGHVAEGALSGPLAGQVTVIGNTTGALSGPDRGIWKVALYHHDLTTGAAQGSVLASQLGWTTGAWSGCSSTCGAGTQTRSVTCVRADGVSLPDSYCPSTRPASSQSCSDTSACTYGWTPSAWSSCSTTCGAGTQTRNLACTRSDGTTVASSLCPASPPATSQSCTDVSACTYSWYAGPFSACTAQCGGGTQARTVSCERSDGVTVTDGLCPGTRPVSSQACNTQACAPTSDWTGAGATWTVGTEAFGRYTWAEAGITNNGRSNAASFCASLGGTLARPNSQAEWDGLHQHLPNDNKGYWIDGHNNFSCGSATSGSPKAYQYGSIYAPSGTSSVYTGCNCTTSEQGLVAYRYNSGGAIFDGCQSQGSPGAGWLGLMDENLSYAHSNIHGFVCQGAASAPPPSGTGTFTLHTWAQAGITNNGRSNAEAYCAAQGGTLARPDSQTDWDAVHGLLPSDNKGYWIDGHNNFSCGTATPGSPKTYQYGSIFTPSGTGSVYTGCNCTTSEQGLVAYRYNSSGAIFDGCQSQGAPSNGWLGLMDENLSYAHSNIVGFICEDAGAPPPPSGTADYTVLTWAQAGVSNNGRSNAAAYCQAQGGNLARPNSQSDWDTLHGLLPLDNHGYWIDGHNNFSCGTATPGSPKAYQYGSIYAPSGTSSTYTGCNCTTSEQGLVAYRWDGTGTAFDGCQSVGSPSIGALGLMDEQLTYAHGGIHGFVCEGLSGGPTTPPAGGTFQLFDWGTAGVSNNGRSNAEGYCASTGGTLARPDSQADWDALHGLLPVDNYGYWIDGHNNFSCGTATPGSPKAYQYGSIYVPSGTTSVYTGCNCTTSEQGLVAYRYSASGGIFDGCQSQGSPSTGWLGLMDENLSYAHGNIKGFVCEY